METSYEYFKKLGCKEVPLEQVPVDFVWITGCGGDGWYWNFFIKESVAVKALEKGGVTDNENRTVLMAKVAKLLS